MPRMTLFKLLLPTVLCLLKNSPALAAPVTNITTGGPDHYPTTSLHWHECPSEREQKAGIVCAALTVPMDWDDPQGKTITLRMNRFPAQDPIARVGYAIYNPGGPGDSAVNDVIDYATGNDYIDPGILKHFDLIGLDPRGIGRSTPIRCNPDIWNDRVSLYPQTQAEFDQLVSHNKAFAQSCIELSGELVGHVHTMNVAKDLEAVRMALDDEKLNFIGISYGTVIAAQYADLFPQNIRAMVMDGNEDHSESEVIYQYTEYIENELEFVRFTSWCNATKDCALYGEDILKRFTDLLVEAEKSPIPAPGCKTDCRKSVTWEEIPINMQDYLTTKLGPMSDTWYDLAQILKDAFNGDATELSSIWALGENAAVWQGQMVNCLDFPHSSRDVSDLLYQEQLAFTQAPYTRGAQESYIPSAACLGWPYPVLNPPHAVNVSVDAPPILMVNSYYDPETPLSMAVAVQEQIPSAVMLLRNGDGHSSFNLPGEATKAMTQYLIDLTIPAPNTVVNS